MDQKLDDRIKCEKCKLHVRYLFIIAGILAVIGISLALGGNDDALGQISMASTVSSIILSAIAIFMSISGESKLTYTHNKLLETSDRMSGITANIEDANRLLENTITEEFSKIDDIIKRLVQIGRSIDNVEKGMLHRSLSINEGSAVDISMDVLWTIYNNLIAGPADVTQEVTEGLMAYIVTSYSKIGDTDIDNLWEYVESILGNGNRFITGLAWGILMVFIQIGMTRAETAKYFEKRITISEEKRNVIKKFI